MIGMLHVDLQGLELKRIVCLRVGVFDVYVILGQLGTGHVKLEDALDVCEVVTIGRFHADEA